ncbi:MAG: 4-demethylwyosine synthase TYW1 [Candidatus Altiarchaeales archaeon]|nr:MAG: 4-demethylwyosine synthase TYW1 [Candidatus Altiarchaeales archaeon]
MIPTEVKKVLQHQHYHIVGEHSAVKLCYWTKRSILNRGYCYKQKFYGIQSHRCLQMSPAVAWCTQRCLFCWRNVEQTLGIKLDRFDDPSEIIENSIMAQRQLLSGYGGIPDRINEKKFDEAQNPNQVAISLSGEPTIYPRISELIEEFNRRDFTTFLVTNGTLPERLESLDPLPTQLYLSLDAPDEEIYKRVCNPIIPDGWRKINETLNIFPSLNTRRVIRLTAIKGLNMLKVEKYSKLIRIAEPDFVEVKAYMFLGGSRRRLTLGNMPSFDDVRRFSEELSEELGYGIKDQKEDSRVVLLTRDSCNIKIK